MIEFEAFQWDPAYEVQIPWSGGDVPYVDFVRRWSQVSVGAVVPTLSGGVLTAACPPELLTAPGDVVVYLRRVNTDALAGVIHVIPRAKPDDYIYTAAERKAWSELAAEVEALKSTAGGAVTDAQIAAAVGAYLQENPVSGLPAAAASLLLTILRGGAYTSDQSANIAALETALGTSGGDSGGSEGGGSEGGDSGETHTHSYTATVTTAATCTTAGVRTYTCACGSSYTEPIPAAGHRYSDVICTVCGTADPDAGGETVTYTVTSTLTNVSTSNTAATVAEGAAYTATLTPDTGYVLGAVTVTMGGVDVTAEALSGRTISIAAVTGDLVITAAAETDTRTLLHHWDLTKSLTDTVGGAAITLNGATQDANGLTLGSAAAYATLDEAVTNRKEVTIEVDFGDMSRTGTAHGRLLMATAANGFIYRNTGSWQIYMDAWSGDTLETDANAFANSTLVIKQSGDFSNSSSGSHYWTVEHNGKVIVEKARASGYGLTLKLGSSSNSYYTAVIKAIRVYEGAA